MQLTNGVQENKFVFPLVPGVLFIQLDSSGVSCCVAEIPLMKYLPPFEYIGTTA